MGNTQVNTQPRGRSRFEAEDSIEFTLHVLIGPTSPKQFVVALRAIDNQHRGNES